METEEFLTVNEIMKAELENVYEGLAKLHNMVKNNKLKYQHQKDLDILFTLRLQQIETIKEYIKWNPE